MSSQSWRWCRKRISCGFTPGRARVADILVLHGTAVKLVEFSFSALCCLPVPSAHTPAVMRRMKTEATNMMRRVWSWSSHDHLDCTWWWLLLWYILSWIMWHIPSVSGVDPRRSLRHTNSGWSGQQYLEWSSPPPQILDYHPITWL